MIRDPDRDLRQTDLDPGGPQDLDPQYTAFETQKISALYSVLYISLPSPVSQGHKNRRSFATSSASVHSSAAMQTSSSSRSRSMFSSVFKGTVSWECNNFLCTYDIYSLMHNVLDTCISILRASGTGLGPGIREFFGPCEKKGIEPLGECHFQGPTPSHLPK